MYPWMKRPPESDREALFLPQEVQRGDGQRAIRAEVHASPRARRRARVEAALLAARARLREQQRVVVRRARVVGPVPHHRRQAAPRQRLREVRSVRQTHVAEREARALHRALVRHRHLHRLPRGKLDQRLLRLLRPRLPRHALLRVP